ncbi:hypothetical protein JFN88_12030, partial [Paenibacillus sp. MAHUQ-46]|nr:hypothetical protein [Paenibacillus roseus]
ISVNDLNFLKLTESDLSKFISLNTISLPRTTTTKNIKKVDFQKQLILSSRLDEFYFNGLQRYISNYSSTQTMFNVSHTAFRITNDFQSAGFLADEIVYFLEKRVPFTRIKNRIFREVKNISWIRGIRIKYSGRSAGKSKKAQRSMKDCVKFGQTSLHVFTDRIDYASRRAQTSFGSIGIKVWICYQNL